VLLFEHLLFEHLLFDLLRGARSIVYEHNFSQSLLSLSLFLNNLLVGIFCLILKHPDWRRGGRATSAGKCDQVNTTGLGRHDCREGTITLAMCIYLLILTHLMMSVRVKSNIMR
jgi:hypothetical protein